MVFQKIFFPAEEVAQLQTQEVIITTRVDKEYHKYPVGCVLQTPWGKPYQVIDSKEISSVKEHPYYSSLTSEQIKLLTPYCQIEVLTLQKRK